MGRIFQVRGNMVTLRFLVAVVAVGCADEAIVLPVVSDPALVASCARDWESDEEFVAIGPGVWRFRFPATLNGCGMHLTATTLDTGSSTPRFEGSYTVCNTCPEEREVSWLSVVDEQQNAGLEVDQLGIWPLLVLVDDRGNSYIGGCRSMNIRPSEGAKYGVRYLRIAGGERVQNNIDLTASDALSHGVPQDTPYWDSPLDYQSAGLDAVLLPAVAPRALPINIKEICYEAGITSSNETNISPSTHFSYKLNSRVMFPAVIRDHLSK
jgi:hypothetical protein